MQTTIAPYGQPAPITIAAGGSIAVYSAGLAFVRQLVGYPNLPSVANPVGTVNAGQTVFGPYASGATIIVEAGAKGATYEVGVAPRVQDTKLTMSVVQPAPTAVDVTGPVSATAVLAGLVTSSTAAAVAGTIPTGTVMDQASTFNVDDAFDWSLINTGGNTFTVTAASGHTIVGVAAVVTVTSARFRTRKTAANTFVTYRLS